MEQGSFCGMKCCYHCFVVNGEYEITRLIAVTRVDWFLCHLWYQLSPGIHLPECGTCQCPLTVKHILVECVDLKDVRNEHFVASSIKDLFDNIEANKNHCFY